MWRRNIRSDRTISVLPRDGRFPGSGIPEIVPQEFESINGVADTDTECSLSEVSDRELTNSIKSDTKTEI